MIKTIGKIIEVVLVIPGMFNESQRRAIKSAGNQSGLNILRLVTNQTCSLVKRCMLNNKKIRCVTIS
jgi:hypothetical protein